MGAGRVAATCVSVAVVAGCALLVAGMSSAGSGPDATDTPFAMPTSSSAYRAAQWSQAARETSADTPTASSSSAQQTVSRPAPSTSAPIATTAARRVGSSTTAGGATTGARPSSPAPARATAPAPVRGQALPVAGSTSNATRVITVLAAHRWSTTATLQAWDRAPGGGWLKHGGAVTAHVGSQGLTTTPNESLSATPIGSFTLTQAFGWKANPGTSLAYFRTNSADWWISEDGPLYNTHQHCSSGCRFDTTISYNNPNEHLAAIPVYAEAVVIDYNTRNSPTGVQPGKGSAFFLHVTDGSATAGCVAIPESNLVAIMKWLTPTARPRILIGVAG